MNITIGNTVTMTSLELVDFINGNRKEGMAELQHKHFLDKVPLVLGGGCAEFSATYQHPQNKQIYTMYRFPKREACLMAMSYSYDIQAKVFDRMTALETKAIPTPTIPNFEDPYESALAWADQFKQKQIAQKAEIIALEQRDHALATKAQISDKKTATAMNTASQAVKRATSLQIELDQSKLYAMVKRMETANLGKTFNWRILKRFAEELGRPSLDVFDANYGTVKAYHADVWAKAYEIKFNTTH